MCAVNEACADTRAALCLVVPASYVNKLGRVFGAEITFVQLSECAAPIDRREAEKRAVMERSVVIVASRYVPALPG